MTTETKRTTANIDPNLDRLQEFNERFLEQSRKFGQGYLDTA